MEEKSYYDKVNDWLDADSETRSLELGAMLMLQGNRNRILHQNVLRKQNVEKVVYELEKIMAGKRTTAEQKSVPKIDENRTGIAIAEIEKSIEAAKFVGKRPDHDALPADIQSIIEKNMELYRQMRSTFERLKILSTENNTPADRIPFIQELMTMDATLQANWEMYDKFDPKAPVQITPVKEALDIKQIQSYRTYLSRAAKKEKLNDKALEETQTRYNELILDGQTVSPETTAKLKFLGVIVQEIGTTVE